MEIPKVNDSIEVKYKNDSGSEESVLLDVIFVDDDPDFTFIDDDLKEKEAVLVIQGEMSNPRENVVGDLVEEDTRPFEIIFSDTTSLITRAKEDHITNAEALGSDIEISIHSDQ